LIKKREGDSLVFRTPGGEQTLEILKVEYKAIE
jgi:transcription elongation GreA/GreB family factor